MEERLWRTTEYEGLVTCLKKVSVGLNVSRKTKKNKALGKKIDKL